VWPRPQPASGTRTPPERWLRLERADHSLARLDSRPRVPTPAARQGGPQIVSMEARTSWNGAVLLRGAKGRPRALTARCGGGAIASLVDAARRRLPARSLRWIGCSGRLSDCACSASRALPAAGAAEEAPRTSSPERAHEPHANPVRRRGGRLPADRCGCTSVGGRPRDGGSSASSASADAAGHARRFRPGAVRA
jgi:hypothetical protein